MGLVGVGGFGAPELMIILVIILLLFGASRLGSLGREMGRSVVEFRKAAREPDEEERTGQEEERWRAESAAAHVSVNGAGERDYRPVGTAPAPPQSAPSRPPDFTGG